jgi:DNA-binding transcriptional LysR family regulator
VKQVRRLNQLWNWLPAFRAVGETQHLPSASQELHVSPSALSRAIKLLEDELGTELFKRSTRGLELTDEGRRFLESVRQAMQALDDGAAALESGNFTRRLTVSTSTPFARELILPALRHLDRLQLEVRVESVDLSRVADRLLDGSVDLALLSEPPRVDGLVAEPLLRIQQGVYCGQSHPLFGQPTITMDALLAYPFVAPPAPVSDGWPAEVPRKVRLYISQLALGIDACIEGSVLAVLPELAAQRAVQEHKLRRLPVEVGSEITTYLLRRDAAGIPPVALEALVAAIRRRARDVSTNVRGQRPDHAGDTLRLAPLR